MTLRLNAKQLRGLIESIEDAGGDATDLRGELGALEPEVKRAPPAQRGSRFREEEEETMEERLNNRGWGNLFSNGIPCEKIKDYDYRFTKDELIDQCRKAGLGVSGDKAELAAKLIAHNKGDNEDDRRTGRPEQAEGVVR